MADSAVLARRPLDQSQLLETIDEPDGTGRSEPEDLLQQSDRWLLEKVLEGGQRGGGGRGSAGCPRDRISHPIG
jgi:hypothetical protein